MVQAVMTVQVLFVRAHDVVIVQVYMHTGGSSLARSAHHKPMI